MGVAGGQVIVFGKLEAVAVSYLSAYLAALQASAAAVVVAPDLIWPSFAGAGVAATWTLQPMLKEDNKDLIIIIAIKAAITMFCGFAFARFTGVTIHNNLTLDYLPEAELGFTLFCCGVAGEKFVHLFMASKPADWLSLAQTKGLTLIRFLASLRPGGGK